ncbi:hypothetical protein POM88_021312 [Heracleum sosnowskyi]|uniref:Uncharacterized protein n=1 Tax=Heracleum sosnowskyi TaxID=360622 RepID=A0AAD8IFK0_9APIA|nr:hypothetical protein POM88_021312 [Heracleum sosnowskyi]
MDAKSHDWTRRNAGSRKRAPGASRDPRKLLKPLQESSTSFNLVPAEEVERNYYVGRRIDAASSNLRVLRATGSLRVTRPSFDDTLPEISKLSEKSQADSTKIVPANSSLNSFAHANMRNQDAPSRLPEKRYLRSKTVTSIDPLAELQEKQLSEHVLNFSEELSADYNDIQGIAILIVLLKNPVSVEMNEVHKTESKDSINPHKDLNRSCMHEVCS